MRRITGKQVRELRDGNSQAAFGYRLRQQVASLLGLEAEQVPAISAAQVSRWESGGLDVSSNRLASIVYLVAMRRMQDG